MKHQCNKNLHGIITALARTVDITFCPLALFICHEIQSRARVPEGESNSREQRKFIHVSQNKFVKSEKKLGLTGDFYERYKRLKYNDAFFFFFFSFIYNSPFYIKSPF